MHGGRELVFEGTLDKDRENGSINQVVGGAKCRFGEWTGDQEAQDHDAQVEDHAQEVEVDAQEAWDGFKAVVRDAKNQASSRTGRRTAATRLNRS
jgi:uncharacterized protein YjbJ (UPF0337 family)